MCSLRPARYKAFTIAHQGRRNNIHPVVSGESHRQTGSLHCTLINQLDIKLFVCLFVCYCYIGGAGADLGYLVAKQNLG